MERKKTLLEKYEIPLNHLDFAYIEKCRNTRELEKMVQILRSGEEGFYPDLTKRAEEKLRQLKPDSKLLRVEEPIKSRHSLKADEWKPIYDWTHEIKTKDNKLSVLKDQKAKEAATSYEASLPPIRKNGKISSEHPSKEETGAERVSVSRSSTERIKTIDYAKWDKYDPDEEMLKMDLAEERAVEEIERENRINLQKAASSTQPKIVELDDDEVDNKEQVWLKQLTDLEREQLAQDYRVRGNEYFKAKEYENAIAEYSKAIKMNAATAASAYNNRAVANIKLQKYLDAIEDCEQCLQLEPQNVKAWLRKADASCRYGRRRESYEVYQKVLEMDASNAVALKAIAELRTQLGGDLPPLNATRLQIQEVKTTQRSSLKAAAVKKPPESSKAVAKTVTNAATKAATNLVVKSSVQSATKTAAKSKPQEYNLAELIVPNRVVESKLSTAAAALGQAMRKSKPAESEKKRTRPKNPRAEPELRLSFNSQSTNRLLIEEI